MTGLLPNKSVMYLPGPPCFPQADIKLAGIRLAITIRESMPCKPSCPKWKHMIYHSPDYKSMKVELYFIYLFF